jgi:hypothetical protein
MNHLLAPNLSRIRRILLLNSVPEEMSINVHARQSIWLHFSIAATAGVVTEAPMRPIVTAACAPRAQAPAAGHAQT